MIDEISIHSFIRPHRNHDHNCVVGSAKFLVETQNLASLQIQNRNLLIQIQRLQNLLVRLRIVHFKIRQKFATTSNHSQKSTAS